MDDQPLIVNLDDPEDVVRAFERATAILRDKREAAAQAERTVKGLAAFLPPGHPAAKWQMAGELLANLFQPRTPTVLSPPEQPNTEPPDEQGSSVQDLAIALLEREPRKLRARDVHQALVAEGHDVSYDQVNNGLYYAATTAKRIWKPPGRGFYAPHSYTEEVLYDTTGNGTEPQDHSATPTEGEP